MKLTYGYPEGNVFLTSDPNDIAVKATDMPLEEIWRCQVEMIGDEPSAEEMVSHPEAASKYLAWKTKQQPRQPGYN